MELFQSVNDETLAELIRGATRKLVYIAPGIGSITTRALKQVIEEGKVSLSIIIDADEDAYRIGYGDHEALSVLQEVACLQHFPLRRQPGLRIGILVVDERLVVWAPTAQSVEPQCQQQQPNALFLEGAIVEQMEAAVGSDHSQVLPTQAEIGREALPLELLKETVESLSINPPAPFDLARKSRVFSTRFQFVECEVRGAQWTNRQIRLSNFLLNADLPESIQKIMATQIRPFKFASEVSFEVPLLNNGEIAYRADGTPMMVAANQTRVGKYWEDIRDRYLTRVEGFGWLIRKDDLEKFKKATSAYEKLLKDWVDAFKEHIEAEEVALVDSIVTSISDRIDRSTTPNLHQGMDLRAEVTKNLKRMRLMKPKVRMVLKNVSWESSRDKEFTKALTQAFTPDELQGWFEEFTAVGQRSLSLE